VINKILFLMEIEFIVARNVARGFIPEKYSEAMVSLQGGNCHPTRRRDTRLGQKRNVSAKYEHRRVSNPMGQEPNKIIYSMIQVSKHYDKKPVLKDISISFFYGAKIGVLGLNGSGKSTLLRIFAGIDKEFNGKTSISPGLTVGLLDQEPELDNTKTVRDIVEEGLQETVALVNEFNRINELFANPMSEDEMNRLIERQGEVQEKIDALEAWDLDSRLEMAMDALRCAPGETPVNVLSGGERRRVALCRLLLQQPDILLLDEPTNHLDTESVAWLEQHLQRYAGTVIAVTHDRYFLDNVAGWILELDRGEGIPWKGNYSSWLEQKQKRLQIEGKGESKRQKTLERELEWIRMSPKGRHAKSKARISAYESLLSQDNEKREKDLEIYIPPGPRLGDVVIKAVNVSKAYGDRLLMEGLAFSIPSGAIVGVIGPNGAGKTTLFRTITGQEQATSGEFKIGETVQLAYVDQSRDALSPVKTVWEVISDGQDTISLGNRQVNSRAYAARFNFSGTDQQKKVGNLSGGERNRVHLARILKEGANVLLLDEPTNDLDVNTLRALEEALENFGGCAIIISHDRWFLDRIATHILAFEGDSKVIWFDGNYTEYEADKKKRLGEAAAQPHRIKYRKLTRRILAE
jgi:ATP-binding cassette ChvD family protein